MKVVIAYNKKWQGDYMSKKKLIVLLILALIGILIGLTTGKSLTSNIIDLIGKIF
jgi:hypothetical protein